MKGADANACLACGLTSGALPLPGGRIHETPRWVVEHSVAPLGVGTLVVKPLRHVVHVSALDADETAELGPLLQRTAAVVQSLTSADQVYVCLWSHAGWVAGHVHFVVQPAWAAQRAHAPGPGPALQMAMFHAARPPDPDAVSAFAERARDAFAGMLAPIASSAGADARRLADCAEEPMTPSRRPDAPIVIRPATLADLPALEALIAASARGLSRADYSDAQIEAALGTALGVDTQLVRDGTYFAVEAGGALVGCGGWSHRRTLFGGDAQAGREAEALDPARDAARVRAFFVHPDWARRGLGRALLERCEREALARGFRAAELMATLPGERLYRACGYTATGRLEHPLRGGVTIPFVPMRKELA